MYIHFTRAQCRAYPKLIPFLTQPEDTEEEDKGKPESDADSHDEPEGKPLKRKQPETATPTGVRFKTRSKESSGKAPRNVNIEDAHRVIKDAWMVVSPVLSKRKSGRTKDSELDAHFLQDIEVFCSNACIC